MGAPQFTQYFHVVEGEWEEISKGDHGFKNALKKQPGDSITATSTSSAPWEGTSFNSLFRSVLLCICFSLWFRFPSLLKWVERHCRPLTQGLKK